jgi:hypothetical protein
VHFLLAEMGTHVPDGKKKEILDACRVGRVRYTENGDLSVASFRRQPFFDDTVAFYCDFFRLDHQSLLMDAMAMIVPKNNRQKNARYHIEQEKKIREMDPHTLQRANRLIRTSPWLLTMETFSKRLFKLKEMPHANFERLRLRLKIQVPFEIQTATKLYAYIKHWRDNGHTLIPEKEVLFSQFLTHSKFGKDAQHDARYLEPAFGYLLNKVVVYVDETQTQKLCLPKDKHACMDIVKALVRMQRCVKKPAQRGWEVPCIPEAHLTQEQQQVARHIVQNPITMLQGLPGSGKTSVIVWIMSRFKAPLVVTYVGMMVDALQRRLGNGRPETANTIHYVYCTAQFVREAAQEWLSQFDLIVLDEASNVDLHLLAKLISVVPLACKIVLVGDLGQIFPIKPGCPFYDLVHSLPEHAFELTENKRVDPDALSLAHASGHIRAGNPHLMDAGTVEQGAPVSFVERPPGKQTTQEHVRSVMRRILLPMLESPSDLQHVQIVVLRNDVRRIINRTVEELLLETKLLPSKNGKRVRLDGRADFYLFPGKKIMFLKNSKNDGVRNGELAQVQRVQREDGGKLVLYTTKQKRIVIHRDEGVDPDSIDYGYATTCNKSQGSEWKRIIFWIHPDLTPDWVDESTDPWFTREFPYVAVSRAKKQCIVVGTMDEMKRLCNKRAKPRDTVLGYYLRDKKDFFSSMVPYDSVRLRDFSRLRLLPASVDAVPTLAAAMRRLKQAESQEEENGPAYKKTKTTREEHDEYTEYNI